jgi:hypothetical protein
MMGAPAALATMHLALLADRPRGDRHAGQVHAVLAWTDRGQRHYHPIDPTPIPTTPAPASQLTLELGQLTAAAPSSSGLTWSTWSLASVPADLRHLPPARAAQALAAQLGA